MNVYVDTNVIIDLLAKREPFFNDARELFAQIAADNGLNGYTSVKSVSDVYYIIHHCLHDKKEAGKMIVKLISVLYVADNNDIDMLRSFSYKEGDFEGNLISALSARLKLDYIVTRNIKDFGGSAVKAVTPVECLDILKLPEISAD